MTPLVKWHLVGHGVAYKYQNAVPIKAFVNFHFEIDDIMEVVLYSMIMTPLEKWQLCTVSSYHGTKLMRPFCPRECRSTQYSFHSSKEYLGLKIDEYPCFLFLKTWQVRQRERHYYSHYYSHHYHDDCSFQKICWVRCQTRLGKSINILIPVGHRLLNEWYERVLRFALPCIIGLLSFVLFFLPSFEYHTA